MSGFRKNMQILGATAMLAVMAGVMPATAAPTPSPAPGLLDKLTGHTDKKDSSDDKPCNTAAAAAIGGAAGALLGHGKKNKIIGAVVGAGIGAFACMAYNYHVKQTKDAKTVEKAYQSKNKSLPTANTIAEYDSSLIPGKTIKAGNKATMQSTITVLNGTKDGAPNLKQELVLLSPEGKKLSTITKDASQIKGSGQYQTQFVFNLPKGIQEGEYTVKSTLFMDGAKVKSKDIQMVVVA